MGRASVHHHPPRPVWAGRITSAELVRPGPPVVHDFMALGLFTSGSAVVHQGHDFEVRAGDVYLVPAGAPHGVISARAPEAWGAGFSPSCYAATELAALLDPFHRAASGASKVVSIAPERQSYLEGLFGELHRETSGGGSGEHVALVEKSLLGLILAEVARASPGATTAGAPEGIVSEALRFIERNCLGPITLQDVASFVRRSPSHLSTTVRRATGKSVMAWIISGRLAEARSRLLHTDEMVDVIAERVGYADPTHFIRLFRRAHGATPSAWRAQQRRGESWSASPRS